MRKMIKFCIKVLKWVAYFSATFTLSPPYNILGVLMPLQMKDISGSMYELNRNNVIKGRVQLLVLPVKMGGYENATMLVTERYLV